MRGEGRQGMRVGARAIAGTVNEAIEAELKRKYQGRSGPSEDDNDNSPLEWYVVKLHWDKVGEVRLLVPDHEGYTPV